MIMSNILEFHLLGLQDVDYFSLEVSKFALSSPVLKKIIQYVNDGEYLTVLNFFEKTALNRTQLIRTCESDMHPFYVIHQYVVDYLTVCEEADDYKQLFVLALAVCYLQLYVQCNYTGPELTSKVRREISLSSDEISSQILIHLECDGNYPYKAVDVPQLLLIARIFLSFLADPFRGCWKEVSLLDESGNLIAPVKSGKDADIIRDASCIHTSSAPTSSCWWSARAAVLHARTLQSGSYETLSSLWVEVKGYFQRTLQEFCGLSPTADISQDASYLFTAPTSSPATIPGACWLEWGLAMNYFSFQDKVSSFRSPCLC
jgi:hypothetical protein